MSKLVIKTGTEEAFFSRGRQLAGFADRNEPMSEERTLSFEDPAEMMRLVTSTRLALFRAVKETPGSITQIAERLHRDRSAVKRDIDELERAGLITVVVKAHPGHGRMKEVRAAATRFSLQVEVA